MNKKIILIVATILILASTALAACNKKSEKTVEENEQKLDLINIAYREHIGYVPLFVGLEKNYFEQVGLKVETLKFESTNQLMEAMLAGQIDASLGGINNFVLFTIEEKSPGEFMAISCAIEASSTPLTYILAKKDSSISSMKDLENKKIGMYPGSFAKVIYKKSVEKYFDPQNADVIQMKAGLQLQALESGQVDALLVLEPIASIGLSKNLVKVINKSLFDKYFINNMPFASSIISKSYIKKNKKAAEKLIQANKLALEFIRKNPQETKKIISKYTPIDIEDMGNMKIQIYEEFNDENKKQVQAVSELFYEEGLLEKNINTDNIYYD